MQRKMFFNKLVKKLLYIFLHKTTVFKYVLYYYYHILDLFQQNNHEFVKFN